MKRIIPPYRLVLFFFLITCSLGCSDDPSSESESCTLLEANEYVYSLMKGPYYWYDEVPDVDYTSYSSPWDLLDRLIRNVSQDKWSYLTTREAYHNYMEEGKYVGIGFGEEVREDSRLFISFVYIDSPAYRAGFERGDEILTINGSSAGEIIDGGLMDTITGPWEVGVMVAFMIRKKNGTTHTLPLYKDWVSINTILDQRVIVKEDKKVAYLAFKSFLLTSIAELTEAITFFREENVDEMILDLRYNGGGRGSVAQYLAGQIAGQNVRDEVFTKYVHNDQFSEWNESVYFEGDDIDGGLDLDRLYVITTDASCSASEMVINNLAPFIDVITIGTTTCGKPVGMYARDFCDLHINAIEFRYDNADNQGSFFDGLPPNCRADDDIAFPLGDPEENSLKQALALINGEACPLQTVAFGPSRPMDLYLDGFRREIGAF